MASSILELMWKRRYHSEKKIYFVKNNEILSQWSYGQILAISYNYAKTLRPLPGKSIIALSYSSEPEFLFSFFACQLAGHIPAPYPSPIALRMQNSARDHSDFFKKSGIHHIITSEPELFLEVPQLNILRPKFNLEDKCDLDSIDFNQLAEEFTIQFSSGSTSEPKGVV
ncbi:MAG: AMP-binding protein, partial [Bdellovibrionales bacterium]